MRGEIELSTEDQNNMAGKNFVFCFRFIRRTIITFKNTHLSNADTEFLVSIYEDWNSDNSSMESNFGKSVKAYKKEITHFHNLNILNKMFQIKSFSDLIQREKKK